MRCLLCRRKTPKSQAKWTPNGAKNPSLVNETSNTEAIPTSTNESDTAFNLAETASKTTVGIWHTHQSFDLWDRAYGLLLEKDSSKALLEKYEQVLLSELHDEQPSAQTSIRLSGFDKEGQMLKLMAKKINAVEKARWYVKVGEETVEIKAQVDRIVKAVLYAKDFVSNAASSDPHVALAWAGVCMLLPVCLIDL